MTLSLYLLVAAALANEPSMEDFGALVVDAKVPVEILINGVKLGQLYFPSETRFLVEQGDHLLRVYTNGLPTDVPIHIEKGHEERVLVGRTGVSKASPAAASTPAPDAATDVAVEFRLLGTASAQVRIDNVRHPVSAGKLLVVPLGTGSHEISVRSGDGTVIWATGRLEVGIGAPLVVMLGEGRIPELTGAGRFHAGGG